MPTTKPSRRNRHTRAARLGVAALSTAAALVGGTQIVDPPPAEARCLGLYDFFYGSDCNSDDTGVYYPYYDPCDPFSPGFAPTADCFIPRQGGGGGGSTPAPPPILAPGQHVPTIGREADFNGPAYITPVVSGLVRNTNPDIIFKNEENGDQFPGNENTDSLMTPILKSRLDRLAELVKAEYPGSKLRVVEALDIDGEHSPRDSTSTEGVSLHYEGRAADISVGTSPDAHDPRKLGRLGQLAVDAGFEWVHFEKNPVHIHVSVPRGPESPPPPAPTPTPPPPPPASAPRPCTGRTCGQIP